MEKWEYYRKCEDVSDWVEGLSASCAPTAWDCAAGRRPSWRRNESRSNATKDRHSYASSSPSWPWTHPGRDRRATTRSPRRSWPSCARPSEADSHPNSSNESPCPAFPRPASFPSPGATEPHGRGSRRWEFVPSAAGTTVRPGCVWIRHSVRHWPLLSLLNTKNNHHLITIHCQH